MTQHLLNKEQMQLMSTQTTGTGSAGVQAPLWGARAQDWGEIQEATVRPLYDEVFEQTRVGPGTALLDVGCGAGLACTIAAGRGAQVAGLDATPELLAIARQRLPGADFQLGDMQSLPYPEHRFDLVTGFNAFQYAASPAPALREAGRVAKAGGQVVIAVWGRPEETQAAGYLKALGSLLPPPPPGAPGPFALSQPEALAALAVEAGLRPRHHGAVPCPWAYPDLETALRGLLAAGPAVRAIQAAGEDRVREAVAESLVPFRRPDGSYLLENTFRYLIAGA
jgi:SAM-dependent methyltransferase